MASIFLIVYTIPNMTQYSVTSMMKKLDLGSIRSSPSYGLSTPYRLTMEQCWTVPLCPCLHGTSAFGPSCTEFVYS